jgi:hypothetical protein
MSALVDLRSFETVKLETLSAGCRGPQPTALFALGWDSTSACIMGFFLRPAQPCAWVPHFPRRVPDPSTLLALGWDSHALRLPVVVAARSIPTHPIVILSDVRRQPNEVEGPRVPQDDHRLGKEFSLPGAPAYRVPCGGWVFQSGRCLFTKILLREPAKRFCRDKLRNHSQPSPAGTAEFSPGRKSGVSRSENPSSLPKAVVAAPRGDYTPPAIRRRMHHHFTRGGSHDH